MISGSMNLGVGANDAFNGFGSRNIWIGDLRWLDFFPAGG